MESVQLLWKKCSEEVQTLRTGCSKAEPKNFHPLQTPFPCMKMHDGQNLISWDGHYLYWQARATVMHATRNGVSPTTNYVTVEKSRHISHIVNSCPLTKFDGGLLRLHEADEATVDWRRRRRFRIDTKVRCAGARVPTLLLTKNPGLFQDFPGPPWKIFQDLFGARECLNIKKKRHLFTIFRV